MTLTARLIEQATKTFMQWRANWLDEQRARGKQAPPVGFARGGTGADDGAHE